MRKKLLLLTKSQQTLLNTFNQNTVDQFKDVIEIYNNPLLLSQLMSTKRDQGQSADKTATGSAPKSNGGSNQISSILLNPLFEFQQETLRTQQDDIESYKNAYNKLLVKCNEISLKLESCQRNLELEVKFLI